MVVVKSPSQLNTSIEWKICRPGSRECLKCDEEIEDVQVSIVDVLQHVMSERESCYQI